MTPVETPLSVCIVIMYVTIIIIITIIIVVRPELGLDRPVSASSNSLFKSLPSLLRQFGLQFTITLGILMLFILATCRSQSDLYLLSSIQLVVL